MAKSSAPSKIPLAHIWKKGLVKSHPDWTCCKTCGIIKRADGKNSPCKGYVRVGPRAATVAKSAAQEIIAGYYLSEDDERRLRAEDRQRREMERFIMSIDKHPGGTLNLDATQAKIAKRRAQRRAKP